MLFKDYNSSSFFQFVLGLAGGFLANARENFGTSRFSHRLGFAETELGQLANDLDDVNLLGASFLDNHIELSLLFDGFGSRSGGTRSGSDSHGRGSRDAPFFFQFLDQF